MNYCRLGKPALPLIALFFAACLFAPSASGQSASVHLNRDAIDFAQQRIERGYFVDDRRDAWHAHKASAEQKNLFIHAHGFAEYAKWHLAVDDSHAADTKAHYKFPFGDFTRVHRCAVLAVKARARQHGYSGIEAAAEQLLARIPRGEKRVD